MLARRARTQLSWEHVFDFRRCDVAVSSLITYNRPDASTCATRRRAFGATGPSRTLLGINSASFTGWGAADTGGGFGAYVTAPDGTNTAREWTVPNSTGSYAFGQIGVSADASGGAVWGIWARLQSGSASLRLNISDVNIVTRTSPNFTVDTTWRYLEFDSSTVGALNNTGNLGFGFTGTGLTGGVTKIEFWHPVAALGRVLGPYIETAGANVTTTDWPRTNYIAKSSKFSSAPWSHLQQGTGVAPAIVSEVVPSPSGSLDATRITFDVGAGGADDLSLMRTSEPAGLIAGASYCAGLWARIPLGATLGFRTVGASAFALLVGTGQWKRYPRPEVSITAAAFVDIGLYVPVGTSTGRVTVDLWHCTLEPGSELTATIPNDTSAPLTVNTPRYGQLTTVAANVPLLEYDADGIGRGLRVDGAFTTTINYTEALDDASWAKNSLAAGAGDFTAHNLRGYATRLVAGGTATLHETYSPSSTVAAGVPLRVVAKADGWSHLVVGLYDGGDKSNVCFNLANGTVGSVWAGAPASAYSITALEDGWYECSVTPSAGGFPTLFLSAQNADSRVAAYSTGNSVSTAIQVARVHTGQGGYLAAEGSAVTRAAASALMVPSAVGLNTTAGSILFDCEFNGSVGPLGQNYMFQLGSNNSSDRMILSRQPSGAHIYSIRDGVEQLSVFIGNPFTTTNRARVVIAWEAGRIYAAVNGGEINVLNAGVPVSFTSLHIGHYPAIAGYELDGLVREVRTTSRTLSLPELVRESAL